MAKQIITRENKALITEEMLHEIILQKHDSIIEMITNFLKTKDLSIEALASAKVKKLETIAATILFRVNEIESTEKRLKDLQISIQAIAADSRIARATFYNNEIFKDFVEFYMITDTTLQDELRKAKDKIKTLNAQIEKMVVRDIEVENLRIETLKLQREIENRDSLIEKLQEQNAINISKINELTLSKTPNIINIIKAKTSIEND